MPHLLVAGALADLATAVALILLYQLLRARLAVAVHAQTEAVIIRLQAHAILQARAIAILFQDRQQ